MLPTAPHRAESGIQVTGTKEEQTQGVWFQPGSRGSWDANILGLDLDYKIIFFQWSTISFSILWQIWSRMDAVLELACEKHLHTQPPSLKGLNNKTWFYWNDILNISNSSLSSGSIFKHASGSSLKINWLFLFPVFFAKACITVAWWFCHSWGAKIVWVVTGHKSVLLKVYIMCSGVLKNSFF